MAENSTGFLFCPLQRSLQSAVTKVPHSFRLAPGCSVQPTPELSRMQCARPSPALARLPCPAPASWNQAHSQPAGSGAVSSAAAALPAVGSASWTGWPSRRAARGCSVLPSTWRLPSTSRLSRGNGKLHQQARTWLQRQTSRYF